MKVLVALLVFAACSAVRASQPALQTLWHNGAELVAPPQTEMLVNGTELREEIIAAFDKYIPKLDQELERQIAWGVSDILQPCGLRFREIQDKMILAPIGGLSPTEFDNSLLYLMGAYDNVVQLVRQGQGSLKMRIGTENFEEHFLKTGVTAMATPRYTLNQLFYGFGQSVIERDFDILRKWLLDTFDSGYKVVKDAVPIIEYNHRELYMWPMVISLQRDALTMSVYDATIQAHSSPNIWSEYVRARNDLWSLSK